MIDRLKILNDKINNAFNLSDKINIRWKNYGIFFLCVIALYFTLSYLGLFNYLNARPNSIHNSAFCQRAGIAQNYYENDMNFFLPRINRFTFGEGITGSEFPIIYYIVAICYKLFGFNEIYFKILSLILYTFAFVSFVKLVNFYSKNIVLSFIISISALTSTVILYYLSGYNPDVPSFCLCVIAWYYFFRFLNLEDNRSLYNFILFATLSALIKVIAIMIFIIVISLVILKRLNYFKYKYDVLKVKSKRIFICIFVGISFIIAWYLYSIWLVNHYKLASFALTTLMAENYEDAKNIMFNMRQTWLLDCYAYETYILLASSVLTIILLYKFTNRLVFTIFILYLIGGIAYFILFLNQFKYHDYYIIAVYHISLFLLLSFVSAFSNATINLKILHIVLIIILIFNIKESLSCTKKQYERRMLTEADYNAGMFLPPYYDLEKKLIKLGITRKDKIISGFDVSYCSTLYLMNRTGTVLHPDYSGQEIAVSINDPQFKYLILNDSANFNKKYPNNLKNKVIGCHRGLLIYKLRD